MGRFTVIPQDTFNSLQLDAGVLLSNFDISAAANDPNEAGFDDDDLITATTGGIQINCNPTFSDLGEDVDNCPENMMELKHLDSWACAISTTAFGTSAELIKLTLGAADINAENKSIIPRADLKQTDFRNLWWVGDKANGGFVAVQILNALATSGLSLQTSKNAKGQTGLEITGHVSLSNQKLVPMIFYSIDPDDTAAQLSALGITGVTLSPAFTSGNDTYTATTTSDSNVITATAAESDAKIVINNGTKTINNGSAATWQTGANNVTVTVTNGDVTKTYTITVTKTNE